MKLFLLDLSFIGWLIVSIATLGFGFIWLVPYYNATITSFYEEVKNSQKSVEQ